MALTTLEQYHGKKFTSFLRPTHMQANHYFDFYNYIPEVLTYICKMEKGVSWVSVWEREGKKKPMAPVNSNLPSAVNQVSCTKQLERG
jgi:hypothetical protein